MKPVRDPKLDAFAEHVRRLVQPTPAGGMSDEEKIADMRRLDPEDVGLTDAQDAELLAIATHPRARRVESTPQDEIVLELKSSDQPEGHYLRSAFRMQLGDIRLDRDPPSVPVVYLGAAKATPDVFVPAPLCYYHRAARLTYGGERYESPLTRHYFKDKAPGTLAAEEVGLGAELRTMDATVVERLREIFARTSSRG